MRSCSARWPCGRSWRFVFWIAVAVIPGIELPSFGAALVTTLAVAVINALLWPIVIRIVLPITVLTFGLAGLALNAGVVMLAFKLVDGEAHRPS